MSADTAAVLAAIERMRARAGRKWVTVDGSTYTLDIGQGIADLDAALDVAEAAARLWAVIDCPYCGPPLLGTGHDPDCPYAPLDDALARLAGQ